MTAGEFVALQNFLRRWDTRRRRQELLRRLPMGLLIGLLLALAAALLSRARPIMTREAVALFALITILISLSVTGLIILLRRRTLHELARFADRQFGLRERATTAVEIRAGRLPVDETLAARQLSDAVVAAAAVDPTRGLPLQARPRDWLPALGALAALAILLWLPNPQEAVLAEQRALAATIAAQAAAIATVAEEIAANDALTAEQREILQGPLEEALATLEEPNLSREEAVAALSQAETELRELSREFDNEALSRALADAANALSGEAAAADLVEALQAGQLAQAGAAAESLAESLNDLPPTDQKSLADGLAEAAESLAGSDEAMADSLARASEALAEGNIAAAQDALSETAAALGDQAQSAQGNAQASSAADQLGEARQEVAQSGETPSTNRGSSGEGQAGNPAGDSGAAAGQEGGAGGASEGGGHVESVYIPSPTGIEGDGENVELDVQCLGDSASCGPLGGQTPAGANEGAAAGSQVPYDQVFGDYRDAAFEALAGGDIPLRLQGLVRDYFSALEP